MATLQVLPLASIVLLTDACEKGRNENICEQLRVSLLYTETGLLRSTQTRSIRRQQEEEEEEEGRK